MDELIESAKDSGHLEQVVGFDGAANHEAELDRIALEKSVRYDSVDTGRDDVALLAFTSGTTGEPRATAHFHRDLLIVAYGYAKEVLEVTPEDVFAGSPPLAFTFGLGGLAIFPLRFGAAVTLLERFPAELGRDHPEAGGGDLLHRADRVSLHVENDRPGRRFLFPARGGLVGRSATAGPEVEAALLSHPAVVECAVIGAPDEERGQIVQAHVVLSKRQADPIWRGV